MAQAITEKGSTLLALADVTEIIGTFLASRGERTRRAYQVDLADFQTHVGAPSPGQAFAALLKAGPRGAFKVVTEYKTTLQSRELAPATVNRRLASLRSLVTFARAAGLVNWNIEVANVKAAKYRDTRGPGAAGVQALLDVIRGDNRKKAIRDRAIIRLLYDLGLRRGEVARLDFADVDLDRPAVCVLGKGRADKEWRTLPEPTVETLRLWLAVRGDSPGPLFINFDRAGKGDGLTPEAIYYLVRRLGEKAGVKARPHGLRHAAITAGLDSTGDVRAVQRYSRHAQLETLITYDDATRDLAGAVARKVAATVKS